MRQCRLFVSLIFLFSLFGCENKPPEVTKTEPSKEAPKKAETPKKHKGQAAVKDGVSDANILQVAISLPDFSTLVTAIKAAGVEDSLVNVGPLTVFAPLNSAFAKLPEGTVETLVKPENKAKLAFILTNHVAPSNYDIKTLKKNVRKGRDLYMASGKYLKVTREGDDIFVSGTKIIKSVKVSNGWIHVIDDVLLPADK